MQHINLPLSNDFEARLNSFNWKDEKLKSKAFECLRTMQEAEGKQIKMNNQKTFMSALCETWANEKEGHWETFSIKAPPLQEPVILHNFGTNEKGELVKIY